MMALRLNVTTNQQAFRDSFEDQLRRLRRAQRSTVNELAFLGMRAVRDEIDRVFDRPTPWIRNGLRVIRVGETVLSSRATREDDRAAAEAILAGDGKIEAVVDWREGNDRSEGQGGGAVPARKIIRAQVEGGARRLKRFERALAEKGLLPPGRIAVPAAGARLDRYGNLGAGTITAILSDLRVFQEQGFRGNRAQGVRARFFVVRGLREGLRLPPGIYERRRRGASRMVIAFVKPASYRPRFDPMGVVRRVFAERAAQVWTEKARRYGLA